MPEPTFGAWLSRRLRSREWSGADLARQIGTGNSTVTQWLGDSRIPSPTSCEKIADALHLDIETVLAAAGHYHPAGDLDPDSPEARIIAMVRRVDWSDPVKVMSIEGVLRMYLDEARRSKR